MAAKPETPAHVDDERDSVRLPRAVEGGTIYYESLGRWIDDLMGDSRQRREAEETLDQVFARDDEVEDPEPIEPPVPVPGGSTPITRNGEPDPRRG
ncbi:MAG: hypothetical protein M3P11_13515 [Actinomycetota bacterium]|nr:hypothetical protein [Actinomycetota bacterium]